MSFYEVSAANRDRQLTTTSDTPAACTRCPMLGFGPTPCANVPRSYVTYYADYPGKRGLQNVVSAWMGAHVHNFDVRLAGKLESVIDTELAYDIKLTELQEQKPG